MRKKMSMYLQLLFWGCLVAVFPFSCQESVPKSEIVFISDRSGNQDIYLLNINTGSVIALTQNSSEDWSPSWSPDGSKLAFSSTRNEGWNIYVMRVKNRKVIQLTNGGEDRRPSWSPDGKQIAFTSARDGNSEIYVMNANGSNPRNVTNHQARDDRPQWSPDGERIAFSSNRDGDWDIYILNVMTGEVEKLIESEVQDFPGAWSKDGEGILLESDSNIVHYSLANGLKTTLAEHDFKEGTPVYSPDGEWIAFESDRSGDYDIWLMKADGSESRNLTNHPAFDWYPQWRPTR